MKVHYARRGLNVSDVSMDLFMKIMQTIEVHTKDAGRQQKAEQWRALAREEEDVRFREV